MKLTISEHNRLAYVEALDAILVAGSDALDADATWESIMHLRKTLAGEPFKYSQQQSQEGGGG